MRRSLPLAGLVLALALPAAHAREGEPLTTSDGYVVHVVADEPYRSDRPRLQAFVDFLATRLHGDELGELELHVLTPERTARVCGPESGGCYDPNNGRIFVPGERPPGEDSTAAFVLTHEYGHHIAGHRRNDPWRAALWGPKHWATHERVCAGEKAGRYHPGDQRDHYFSNPGEAWAEAYATLHYPENDWRWHPALRPDEKAFAAIRRDVLSPWRRPVVRRTRGRLGERRRHLFRLPLDGTVVVSLRAPASAEAVLLLRDGRRVLRRTKRRQATIEACSLRRLTVEVRLRRGGGRYRLVVRRP